MILLRIFRYKFLANRSYVGSIYINQLFSEDDKEAAEELVNLIQQEYIATIKRSNWMDESVKKNAIAIAIKMQKFIGYHEKLRSSEALNYYNDLTRWPSDNFLEMGLSLIIFATDKEFTRIHLKRSDTTTDWTK